MIGWLLCSILFLPSTLKADTGPDKVALMPIEQLLREAKAAEHNQKTHEAMALWFDAFNAYQLYQREYPKAFECANEIERLSQQPGTELYPSTLYYYTAIARLYYEFGDYENSINLLEHVLAHPRLAEQAGTLGRAYYDLGVVYLTTRQFGKAEGSLKLAVHHRSIVVNDSTGSDVWADKGMCGLGVIRFMQGRHRHAATLLRGSVERLSQGGHYKSAGEYAAWLGYAYTKMARPDSAYYYLCEADTYYSMAKPARLRWGLLHFIVSEYELAQGNIGASQAASIVAFREVAERMEELNAIKLVNVRRTPRNWKDDEPVEQEEPFSLFDRVITDLSIGLFILIPLLMFWAYKLMKKSRMVAKKRVPSIEREVEQYRQIMGYMETQKPYLSPTFDIEELCEALHINTKSASAAINHIGQRNFRSMVNHYRINAAIELMNNVQGSKLSIDALALEVGFADRSNFWRAFKKQEGVSPTEYAKQGKKPIEVDA
jgi:AraC-like DNA-binding protein